MPDLRPHQLLILALALLSGCSEEPDALAPAPASTEPSSSIPQPPSAAYMDPEGYLETHLTFAWPKTGKVHVREHRHDRKTRAISEYDISITEKDGKLLLSQENLEYIEVNGKDAKRPELQTQIEDSKSVGTMMDLQVATNGFPIGITNIEAFLSRIDKVYDKKAVNARPEKRRSIEQAKRNLRNTGAIKLASSRALQHWNTWVGNLIDLKIGAGMRKTLQIKNPGIADFEFPAVLEHRGYIREPREHVHIVQEQRIKGEALRAMLAASMPAIEKELRSKGFIRAATSSALLKNIIYGGTAVLRAEVITDPKTLRPDEVYLHKYMELEFKPGIAPRSIELEKVSWTFNWRR